MRFAVSFFAFVASLLTAAVGAGFLLWNEVLTWALANVDIKILDSAGISENSVTSMTGITYANAGLVTLVAAAYGLLGSAFVVFRCGKQAGALLLIPILGAAFMNPVSLVFTWFGALIALFCFFIGPLPITPAEVKDADDGEDDEDDGPKPQARKKVESDDEDEDRPRPKARPKPRKFDDD